MIMPLIMPLRVSVIFVVFLVGSSQAQGQGDPKALVGTWRVASRVDRDSMGRESVEPTLGRSPLGFLIYDGSGHVAAQLMARDRSPTACRDRAVKASMHNSTFICRYDAYFGRYEVDTANATVTHILEGALAPADVGKRLPRHYVLTADTLTLSLQTVGASGRRVTRILVLHRISH
ncbi:MAG: lipocalin-like domain-containing protein [Gemmatimonadaceae bacterium]